MASNTYYKGLTVVIDGNVYKLKKKMGELRAEGTVLRSHLSTLSKLIEFNPASTELLAQKQRMLGTALAQNAAQIQTMKAAEAAYHAQVGPHTAAEEAEYRNLQRRLSQIQLEYQQLKQQAIQFGAAASASTLKWRGRAQSMQQTLSTVSNKFLAVGVATGIAGAMALKSAISFEQAFADVRKTIIATEDEYEKLAYDIRQMALIKPISPEDLAYIESLGGQLNVATQYLTKFTSTIADLDIATDMNLEDASLQLARFMNIAGMGQQDVDRLGATIVDLGNNSATTESQIMLMAMRIVGSASNIGMSAPNVLALATALSSVGIQAEMGGNAISTIMNRIDKDVALNSSTLATWANVAGMSAQEFANYWQTDVTGALTAVVTGMGTFRDEGNNLNLLLKDLGINYMRQIDTMQRLSRTGDILTEAFQRSDTAWEQNIALTREASQRYETAESKMKMMQNALNEAGITIGNEILPYFKELVVGVTNGIQAFAKMDAGTKQLILTIAGGVTMFSLGVKGLELMAGGAAKVLGTFASLKTAMAFYIAEKTVDTATTAANTVAETANTAATTANTTARGANAVATDLETASTAAETVAESANVVAKRAAIDATAKEVASSNILVVAKRALSTVTTQLTAITGMGTVASLGFAGALSAAVVAAIALGAAAADAYDDTDELTEASSRNKKALDDAQATYDRAIEEHGELSNEALAAKAALDEENDAFESAKETIGEFCARMDETIDAHNRTVDTIKTTSNEANSSAGSILNLANQFSELINTEDRDADSKARLSAIVNSLNTQIDGLGLAYDANTDKVNLNADAVQALAEKEAQRLQADAALENLSSLYAEQAQLAVDLKDAQSELDAETQANIDAFGMLGDTQVWTSHAQIQLEGTVDDLTSALEENRRKVKEQAAILRDMQSKELALKYAADAVAAGTMSAATAASVMGMRFSATITEAEVLAEREARVAEQAQQAAIDVSEVVSKLEELEAENDALCIAITDSRMGIEDFAKKMVEAGIKAEDLAKGVEEISEKTSDAFNKIEYESDLSLNSMIKTLDNNIEKTRSWGDNMAKLYERGGSASRNAFIKYIGNLGVEYAPIVSQLLSVSDDVFDQLAGKYAEAGHAAPLAYLQAHGMLTSELQYQYDQMTSDQQDALNEMVNQAEQSGTDVSNALAENIQSSAAQSAMAGLVEGVDYEAGQLPGKVQENTEGTGSEIADGIMAQSDAAAGAADTISKLVADHFSSASTDAWWAGNNMTGQSFRDGLDAGRGAAVASADTASKHVADHLSSANGDAWWAGYNMMRGMQSGISDGRSLVVNAARQAAFDAMEAAKQEAQINSPSKKWRRVIGWGLMEGGAAGIKDKTYLMVEAARGATSRTNSAAEKELNRSLLARTRKIDNGSMVPTDVLSMLTYPKEYRSLSQRRRDELAPDPIRGGGTQIANEWNIYSNNPEEVAAMVAVRERRQYSG